MSRFDRRQRTRLEGTEYSAGQSVALYRALRGPVETGDIDRDEKHVWHFQKEMFSERLLHIFPMFEMIFAVEFENGKDFCFYDINSFIFSMGERLHIIYRTYLVSPSNQLGYSVWRNSGFVPATALLTNTALNSSNLYRQIFELNPVFLETKISQD